MKNESKKIHIGKSSLHGKGIFASRDIKKGEIIFTIKGRRINFLINGKRQAKIAKLNWIGLGKNTWIDPIEYGLYINHSCHPNSIIKGKITVIALRDIKRGEEVTMDYSLNEADIFWDIKCECGYKNCRKIIKSIQFLPKNIFKKYKSYVPKYFQRVYREFNLFKLKNYKNLETKWVNFIKEDFNV